MDPNLEARLSLLLTEMEGEQGDRHEIWMRLRQELDGMRAFGMPVPEDLQRLEDELGREFGPPVAFDAEPEDGAPDGGAA